ncbi:MAG: response regulator transcription factor [Cyanobacteria bacterium Co-bin8]|nr:response regulator transcription factor [Cyanobacteria bacterium Co-bin8]
MKTILIVDDDLTLQAALTRRLQQQGFGVVNATSAAEALSLFDRDRPDVVVSDVLMPQMDGFEFCRRLRASPSGELVPFIFLSSLGEVESRIHAHTIGANDYLVKPFHPRELIAKINGLIERAEKIQAQVERLVGQVRSQADPAAATPEPLPLTPAEAKVFWEVIQGYTNKQIGERLFISPRTVQTHLSNILSKLSLENRSQLIRFAFEHGYQTPSETAETGQS